tara:strand:+ start:238 stop:441 length:204 start_codon:yes stop_codon:yes gene_type:complete
MITLIDELLKEFKKMKRVRGDLFHNFISFVNIYLSGMNDDKYKKVKNNILNYILVNEKDIKMKLIQN